MKCDLFFDREFKEETWYKYDEAYVIYLVYEYFNFYDSISATQFIEMMENEYGAGSIKLIKAAKWLHAHLTQINQENYVLSNNDEEIFECMENFKESYYKNQSYSIVLSHASDRLTKYFTKDYYNLKDALVEYYLLHVTDKYPMEYYCSKLLELLLNLDSYLLLADQYISNIDSTFYSLPLDAFITDEITKNALVISGIYKMSDFINLRVESQFLAFSLDINSVSRLNVFSESFDITGIGIIKNCFACLREKEKEVISRRFNLHKEKEETLEEISEKWDITRERVRQIEASAYRKLEKYANENRYVLYNAFVKADTQQNYYFTIEDGIRIFGSVDLLQRYALLCKAMNSELIYDQEYKVFYNNKYISIDLIVSDITEDLGNVVSIDEYDMKDSLTKAVIEKLYSLKKGKLFVDKKLNYSDLILKLIDDNFPNGYKIGNGEKQDYDEIKKLFVNTYGDEIDFPAERAISALVMRPSSEYCLVGRGLYRRQIYCVDLPDYLKEKVIDFILENSDPTIYYVSIYERFQKEFNAIGVNNYYYMKGLIDPYLTDFTTKRDYVLASPDKITAKEAVKNYMRSLKGIFSLQDLRDRFIGVKDYVFFFILIEEEENGLITLHNNRYFYIENANITMETLERYKSFIEDLFNTTGQDALSTRKIYGRMALTSKSLLSDLSSFIEDQFALFSITKYFFKDEYNYHRPFIFKADAATMTKKEIILKYAEKQSVLTPKVIQDYSMKMNIRGVYSYLNFIDEMSETHVQTGVGTLILKAKLNLSEDFLNRFNEMVQLIFTKTDELDMRQFNGYVLLPKCEYTWNQYLFTGIIRSYFDDEYEIKNTENMYNDTSFIIRRIV